MKHEETVINLPLKLVQVYGRTVTKSKMDGEESKARKNRKLMRTKKKARPKESQHIKLR